MSTFYHHPSAPIRQVNEGQPCPIGWSGPHSEEDSAAWALTWAAVEASKPVETPVQVPAQVTNAQFRAALIDAGILPSQIDAAIAAIPDNSTRLKASEWWQYANYIERASGYVAGFAPQFGLTSAQVDALFISASTQGT